MVSSAALAIGPASQWTPEPQQLIPWPYSGRHDPRFPSARLLRRIMSFFLDVALHAAAATMIAVSAGHSGRPDAFWALSYLAVSLANRVLLQSLFHASAGKLLTGLRVIRREDCRWPSIFLLALHWIAAIIESILDALTFDGGGDLDDGNFWITAVRRGDILRARRDNALVMPAPFGHEPAPGSPWYRPPRPTAPSRRLVWKLDIVWAPPRTGAAAEEAITKAIAVDWLIHAGTGVACAALLYLGTGVPMLACFGVLAWLAASFLHRVIVQRICGNTLGKHLLAYAWPTRTAAGLACSPCLLFG